VKRLATCANEDKRALSAKSPMSENAATGTDREDPPMKALTRGNKDDNNGNVRHEDPCTKAEALAKGSSTKCTETTSVVLEGTPHEMQNEP